MGGFFFSLLWFASPAWSDAAKTAYFIGLSLLFYTCYTVMNVPGTALGWELTPDYSERTRVMTWFSATVKVSLMVLPWMFALTQSPMWANEAQGLRVIGTLFGVLFALTGIVPALVCKERNFKVASQEGRQKLGTALKLTMSNRTFLLVCGISLMCIFAGQVYMLFGTHLAIYYLFDGLKSEGAKVFGLFGTVASITGLITIALINRVFIHADKKKVMLGAIGSALLGWISAIFLITPDQPWLTLIPLMLNAVGVAGFWLLQGSILADVADADELMTGHRREGSLAAVSSFLCKAAGTLGAVLGGLALALSGFDAELGQQAPQALICMKSVYVGFPLFGYSIAFLLTCRYPLTRERMKEIQAELEQRRGKISV